MSQINLRKQIHKEMKKRKISIPVMARKLECHPGTLYDFFAGRKALGADYLQTLLNELGATLKFD
jgi:hypothetical protein